MLCADMDKDDSCLVVGDFSLRLDPNDNDPKSNEVAERELRETPEVRDAAVATLRKMVTEDNELSFPLTGADGDVILMRFLRPCKFYPESAFKKMKNFYKFRFDETSLTKDFLKEEDRILFEPGSFGILPSRDQHGRLTIYSEMGGRWDPSKCSHHDLIRGIFSCLDGIFISAAAQKTGFNLLLNSEGVGWAHLKGTVPTIAMKAVHYLQECEPCRLKAIHVVNNSYIFSLIFAIFKPFLSSKLKSRIHMHGKDRESLFKHIDPSALPTKFGGTVDLPEINGSQLFDFLSFHKKFYSDTASVGYTSKPK